MRKKTIWILLIVGFVVGVLGAPTAALAAGSDTLVAAAAQSTAQTTRAEFAVLAVSELGLTTSDPSTPTFFDVGRSNIYYQYVEGATAAGLMRGLGGSVFGPDLPIGREQVATILARYLASVELKTLGYITGSTGTHYPSLNAWSAAEAEGQLARFSDGATILAVHRSGVAYLAMRGIAETANGWFSPFSSVTETECVALIRRTADVAASFTPPVAAPAVTSIAPASGPDVGGTTVSVYGTDFTADSTVLFGSSAAASVIVNSSTLITAVSPAGTAGTTVQVSVTTSAGTSANTSADNFTYVATGVAPTITYISPDNGWQGDTVSIVGTNFDYSSLAVYFGTVQATNVTYVNSTELLAVVPAGVNGATVQVLVVTNYGATPNTYADLFTYYNPYGTPVISSINPTGGPSTGGTVVYIQGANFTADAAVYFGSSAATSVTVNSSALITAVSPAGTAGSTVQVLVMTAAGTSPNTSADDYTYFAVTAAPTIKSIAPNLGWEGDTVTIRGTHFDGANLAVYFGGVQATSVSYISPTELTAVVPAGTKGETVRVSVVTDDGTSPSTRADQFLYWDGSTPFFPSFPH